MEVEQEEMQFLGFVGIFRESFNIIFSWRKIFSQITLALILPLTFIFLADIEVADVLFRNIMRNEIVLDETRAGTARYNKLSDLISSEWTYFWLFKAAYLTFLLLFSLLSTAAVVYTIASVYTGREVSFKKVMSVVPKVWKRLAVTFLCIFICFVAYNFLSALILVGWIFLSPYGHAQVAVFVLLIILYLVGTVYMSLIWQLASVVSVLEEAYGFKAMGKSKALLRGKMLVASVIFFLLNLSLLGIQHMFGNLVVRPVVGTAERVVIGILCFLLLFKLFLFGLVIQTVLYFVCKSYHHENIDKSALSDHLEVYLGEYVPLKTKDVQLEQFQV